MRRTTIILLLVLAIAALIAFIFTRQKNPATEVNNSETTENVNLGAIEPATWVGPGLYYGMRFTTSWEYESWCRDNFDR